MGDLEWPRQGDFNGAIYISLPFLEACLWLTGRPCLCQGRDIFATNLASALDRGRVTEGE